MMSPYRMQLAANGIPVGVKPDTPPYLEGQYYPEVRDLMLSGDRYSFSTQIRNTFAEHAPEAYLVTAYSAIPVADAIRGFYQELGVDQPLVDYVRPPKGLGRFIVAKAENLRLRSLLAGITGKICVVDEYINTGRAVERSKEVLVKTGVPETDIVSIKGKWYHNARRGDLQVDQTTSAHQDFMNSIGRDACAMAFA
jgi:hypothetical protein